MKNLLNLGKPLTKEAQKSILGGTYPATVCKATCNDGSIVTVASCSVQGCGEDSGGAKSCSCGHAGPLG
ncbi:MULTISPECIES: hypothetical protein [unclassified Lacinutrix]